MGMLVMAKKKAPRVKARADVPATGRKAIAVVIKGGSDWKNWVEALAKHCRTDVSKVLDQALIQYAKSTGFDQEAPER
jgi:hypothetical protein